MHQRAAKSGRARSLQKFHGRQRAQFDIYYRFAAGLVIHYAKHLTLKRRGNAALNTSNALLDAYVSQKLGEGRDAQNYILLADKVINHHHFGCSDGNLRCLSCQWCLYRELKVESFQVRPILETGSDIPGNDDSPSPTSM